MYNNDIKELSPTKNDQILYLIQEIKRNMVLRRYIRATTGPSLINYNDHRIYSHLLLTIEKTIYYKKLEGHKHDFLEEIKEHILQQI